MLALIVKHRHRIVPGHMGGQYIEGNIIEVEVTECNRNTANHVMWHYANWRLWGGAEDLLAWRGLSGFYGKEDIIKESQKLGGKNGGNANVRSGHIEQLGKQIGSRAMSEGGWLYEKRHEYAHLGGEKSRDLGVGLHSLDHSTKAKRLFAEGKGLAAMTPKEKSDAGRKGGTKSGKMHKENKTGVCGISPEEHSKRMSSTNQQKWKCPCCDYVSNARHMNSHLLNKHKLDKTHKIKLK